MTPIDVAILAAYVSVSIAILLLTGALYGLIVRRQQARLYRFTPIRDDRTRELHTLIKGSEWRER